MTEPIYKNHRDNRYRLENPKSDTEPSIDPLALSDEDAIDRLLVDSGFNVVEADSPAVVDDGIDTNLRATVYDVEDLITDPLFASLHSNYDDSIEPVDLALPLFNDESEDNDEFAISQASPRHVEEHSSRGADPEGNEDRGSQRNRIDNKAIEPIDSPAKPVEQSTDLNTINETSPLALNHTQRHRNAEERNQSTHSAIDSGEPFQSGPQATSVSLRLEVLEKQGRITRLIALSALAAAVVALAAALTANRSIAHLLTQQAQIATDTAAVQSSVADLNARLESHDLAVRARVTMPPAQTVTVETKPIQKTAAKTAAIMPKNAGAPIIKPKPGPSKRHPNPTPRQRQIAKHTDIATTLKTPNPIKANARQTGNWSIYLASFSQRHDAERKAAELRRQGLAVQIAEVALKKKIWFRVGIPGFSSQESARNRSVQLKKRLRSHSIWIASN